MRHGKKPLQINLPSARRASGRRVRKHDLADVGGVSLQRRHRIPAKLLRVRRGKLQGQVFRSHRFDNRHRAVEIVQKPGLIGLRLQQQAHSRWRLRASIGQVLH